MKPEFKQMLSEENFKTYELALKAAKDKVKKHSDAQQDIMIYKLRGGGFDLNAEMNSAGREHIIRHGGKLVAKVNQKRVWKPKK